MLVKGKSCTRAKLSGKNSQVGKFRKNQDGNWNRNRVHGQPGLRIQQQVRSAVPARSWVTASVPESPKPVVTEVVESTAISIAIEQIAQIAGTDGGPTALA